MFEKSSCARTQKFRGHRECRKMRSRGEKKKKRSLKFQGDTREEIRASSRSGDGSDLPGNWPHQYENEPAVTVAAVRLPWHFGCLEEMPLQGGGWRRACVSDRVQGLLTGVLKPRSRLLSVLGTLLQSCCKKPYNAAEAQSAYEKIRSLS